MLSISIPKISGNSASGQLRAQASSYLPGLNGIRALASLIIITSHVDEFSYLFNRHQVGFHGKGAGYYGVTLFFVLSGFLVTYLFMREKEKYGTIQLRKFYTRRMLRIWPAYYLIVTITLLLMLLGGILPDGRGKAINILYYLFFIPNVAWVMGKYISLITPLWSIGAQEQFYALWPSVMKKTKNYLFAALSVIGSYLLIKLALQHSRFDTLYRIFSSSRYDCLAIGGLGAYLVHTRHKLLKVIYSKVAQVACWLILAATVIVHAFHIFSFIDNELYSIVFLVMIINVSTNPASIIKLENKVLNFLGKISYGTYLFHMSVIFAFHYFVGNRLNALNDPMHMAVLWISTVTVAIILATLSYEFFEKRFQSVKKEIKEAKNINTAKPGSAKPVEAEMAISL